MTLRAQSLYVVEVDLPHRYDMSIESLYGKLEAMAGATPHPTREDAAAALGVLRAHLSGGQSSLLTEESITFYAPEGERRLRFDVSASPGLLGACRALPPHARGYEPEIECAIAALTAMDAELVDVGAGWGAVSVQHALDPRFRGRIHALEARPGAFAALQRIVDELHLAERILPLRLPISEGGDVDPYGGASPASGGTSLDALLPEASPALVKIGASGRKDRVLAEAGGMIGRGHSFILFEDGLDDGAASTLRAAGYDCYLLGWFDPFQYRVTATPPFTGGRQLLAFQGMDPDRESMGQAGAHVLASPVPLPFRSA